MVNQGFKMSLSKIDTKMDQEKYLREVTRYFRGIEKPLKNGPQINSLQDLITALHREFETNFVNIEMVNHIMLSYQSNEREWKKFAKFDRYKYTRNLVDAGNDKFNLMILCWGESHSSAIHDHADSHCMMKMLKGELKEIRYEMPYALTDNEQNTNISNSNNNNANVMKSVDIGHEITYENSDQIKGEELRQIGETVIGENDVAYINDHLGLHRVENPSHSETAVSLHLYCPPFDSCSVFEKQTGKRLKCNVTFWSKFGTKSSN